VKFLFTVKSFPHELALNIANQYLDGFDVSNINEYNLLPKNLDGKLVIINNPTCNTKNLNEYRKNGNELVFNLDNIKYADQLTDKQIVYGLRLSHTELGLDINEYPYREGLDDKKLSRFGNPLTVLPDFYKTISAPISIHIHNGSERNTEKFYLLAGRKVYDFCTKNGIELRYMNFGGGLHNMTDAEITRLVMGLREFIPQNITILFEPGNALAKDCGFALAKVVSIKKTADRMAVFFDISYECNLKWSTPKLYSIKENGDSDVYFYGASCFEDDYIGTYKFDVKNLPFREGDVVVFSNIHGYAMAWNTQFNGVERARVEFI
jgi:diaminopimelate decarboxylase